ncbi:MAG TPA: PAS domain S-box protein [Pirellulales bacterium]|jgi:PAS domain S-box-containing protein|nr:PAS domain S-box protein [Pirellulales bacterium]
MPNEVNRPAIDQLRGIEEHFSHLVAGVQDYAIFLLDANGYVKTWNAGAERIKGYRATDIIGQHFSKFYPAEALSIGWPAEELVRARRDGRFEDEAWRVRQDGTLFWANVVITALYDQGGDVRGFLKITRDLTDRKRSEEVLRQSEERFRLLVEGVKDYAIFMLDPSGRVASWNAGAERIKGYTAEEIIGQHFSQFYSSEDLERGKPQRELEVAIAEGRVEDEGWRVRKDRSLFWANVVITAIYNEQNQLLGFAKVTRDLTDRKRVQELEIADRQKNEFLAMLAHELRNPLAPISNGLQLLRLPGLDSAVLQETTEMMERQLFHLVRLVDDLLDVSRVITGKLNFHREPVDLADVVRRGIEEAQSTLDARGHELVVTVPGKPLIVDGDLLRLGQVVANLIGNAAKYTPTPSQLRLTVERQAGWGVIKVKDPGIGIAPELLPSVFDLFMQADSSLARSQGGLGIGLTVVKRIMQMHQGTVLAKSEGLGKGSEFVVSLPLSRAQAVAKVRPLKGPAIDFEKRRILVVDDNVDAALSIAALLKAWGHEVQTVFSGPAALETVQTFRPEILLLDIGLPGMSGYEVAQHLRSEPALQGMIIAAVTGYGQESDQQRSFDSGFDYHITKPPDPSILETLILRVPRGAATDLPRH